MGDPVEQWCAVAREGTLLQRELAPHLANLEEAGLRRLGPAEATSYVATRTEQYAALPEGDPRRLDADAAARLRARLPEVEAWADRLLGLGLPLTLVHNDLHELQRLLRRRPDALLRLRRRRARRPLVRPARRGAVADVPARAASPTTRA